MSLLPTPRKTTTVISAAAALAAIALAAAPAQASQYDRNDPLCRTPDGRVPQISNNPGSLHRAYAAMRGGQPVIVFNPRRMADLQPITRVWVYYHECAHHALGHSSGNRALTRENDADCWAIRAMRHRGLLTKAHYRVIVADMRRVYHRGGMLHLPGHLRAEHLGYCLRTTGGYGKIRNARFTPKIVKRQMAMRNGQGNHHNRTRPHADPRLGQPEPQHQSRNRTYTRPGIGRQGEPEPAPRADNRRYGNMQMEEN